MRAHQCHECGKFAKYEDLDWYTPFGCSNPAAPEPFDPTCICKKCSDKLYQHYLESFRNGKRHGDWVKSDAEMRAAKDYGLVWIGSFSKTIDGKKYHNEYVPAGLLIPKDQ